MKTARFADVVMRAGRPEPYTAWMDPKKDVAFQRAVKAGRVMTVHQANVGTKKDYGTVGFEPRPQAMFLVFPRSLASFDGRRVVGVDYAKVPAPPPAPKEATAKTRTKHSAKRKTAAVAKAGKPPPAPSGGKSGAGATVVPFESPPTDRGPASSRTRKTEAQGKVLVRAIRAAMREIKAGKVVAAYERLEQSVARQGE